MTTMHIPITTLRTIQKDPPNLLENEHGNIITQPDEANARKNDDWDSVFATNILRERPIKVLKIAWPYIKDECHPIDFPTSQICPTRFTDGILWQLPA